MFASLADRKDLIRERAMAELKSIRDRGHMDDNQDDYQRKPNA